MAINSTSTTTAEVSLLIKFATSKDINFSTKNAPSSKNASKINCTGNKSIASGKKRNG